MYLLTVSLRFLTLLGTCTSIQQNGQIRQFRVLNDVFSLAKCHDNLPINVLNLLSQSLQIQMLEFYLLGRKMKKDKDPIQPVYWSK